MECPNCRFQNPENMKFCGECGARFERKCLECGYINPPQFKFCGECGHAFEKSSYPIDFSEPQSYTPKHLADKILISRSSIQGERKLVTVFFADIANYTSMSEQLDPEEAHQLMDGCFKILMDEIHKYEGTINQFTGDGVMALFGAPVAHEDHAQRACKAALSIQSAMVGYGDTVKKEYNLTFKMRIGINSGPVIVGTIGDDLRMDYTAVGDTTNIASRMESIATPGSILVSKHTHWLVRDFFHFNSLGKIEIKGKAEPQEAFELIKAGTAVTRIDASIAKGLTRFVGRKNSMGSLLKVFDSAKSGSGQVIGIVGEAGVGKSRLLLEMRNLLPQGEYYYFEGHCLQYGSSMSYLPFLDILRSALDIQEGDREFIVRKKISQKILDIDESLKKTIPPCQGLLSLKVDDQAFAELNPKENRERTFEALRDLMICMSQKKCIVLCIEDLHWIDKTSEEFLDYFIGWLPSTPILLILLYRPEYTHTWGSKSYYTKIGLTQLGKASSTELVQAILEKGKVAPELKALILKRAAGNPLFMEEFTHTLLENGSIEKTGKHYVLKKKDLDIQVPDTIQGIISARMDRLEENLKRTMQVASVIGMDFSFGILQTITGMRDELKSYLLNLQGLEFIYEKRLFPELEYIFKHALTQEVAYNSLLIKRRKEIHEKIGEAIEEIYQNRLEEFYEILAYHYSSGDNFKKACHYAILAGKKAEARYSHQEAYEFYKKAIDLLNKLPETEAVKTEKIEVHNLMRDPMAYMGFPEGSLEMIKEYKRLADELVDHRSINRINVIMAIYHLHRGSPQTGAKYAEQAFKEAKKSKDPSWIVPLACTLTASHNSIGEHYKMVEVVPDIIKLIENQKKESRSFFWAINPYSLLCGHCGAGMGFLGDFEKGEAFLEKGHCNAIKINELTAQAFIELQYVMFFNAKSDFEPAIKHCENCIKYSENINLPLFTAVGWSCLGLAYSQLGDCEQGEKYAEKGLKTHIDSRIDMFLSIQHFNLGRIFFEVGNISKAQSSMEESVALSKKNNEKALEGSSRIHLGRILGKADSENFKRAKDYILKGMGICKELKLKPAYSEGSLYLGELFLNAGKKSKAEKYFKEAEQAFEEMGIDYSLNVTREFIHRL